MESTSPSSITMSPTRALRAAASTSIASAPQTQVRPIPRATTAAWVVLPPRLVRTPAAAIMPSRSSGLVSRRTSTTDSPAACRSTAVAESNTTAPTAAPGDAAMPRASRVRSADRVELGEHQLGQLRAADPLQRLVHGDQLLVDELGGDPERRGGRPLPDAGLQHPQLAALDGELDVAQVAVVGLQPAHDPEQLLRGRGVELGEVGQGQGVADAGDDVLALGVGQVVAVDALLAGGRVAGEADAGAGVGAEVAEDHRAHVHRGAEVVRDPLAAPVDPGAVGVPRLEHRLIARSSCSRGSCGKAARSARATTFLNLDQLLQVGAVSSTSLCHPALALGPSSASANSSPSMPSTVLPNIATRRR